MTERIVITGLGAVTSIGIGWRAFWEGLLEGISGISPISSFDTSRHFTKLGGEVKAFRAEDFVPAERAAAMSRATQLAVVAAALALEDAGLVKEGGVVSAGRGDHTVGVSLGTTMGSVQTVELINERLLVQGRQDIEERVLLQVPTHSTPAAVAGEFGLTGPNIMFSTACAAGNYAIGHGFDLIRSGRADCVVAGGADPLSKVAFTGFNQLSAVAPEKCQPFDLNRKGMIVAEGSGVLVLESLERALARGAGVYAEVLGYGLSCDARHMTQPSEEGIVRCMLNALEAAGVESSGVDYVSAHGTGTVANDAAESAAINRVFSGRRLPVSSIKSMLGHTMGAASALEALVCALVVREDMIPPTINFRTPDPSCDIDCVPNEARSQHVHIALNNSYAFGGNNASLVIAKYEEEGQKEKGHG